MQKETNMEMHHTRNRPSIAFLINSLEFGGAQRVFIDDANEFIRAGYDVVFFELYSGKTEQALVSELSPKIRLQNLGARSPYDMRALRRCMEECKRTNVHTLISTLNDSNRVGQWLVLLSGFRIRQIAREANTLKSKTVLQKILDVCFCWVPYRVIALSTEIQNSLIQLLPFSKKKVVFLPNATDVHLEHVRSYESLVPRILSVGRLQEQKNYDLLVRVLTILHQEGIAFTATVIGDGVLRTELENQVREAHLEDILSFVGYLPFEGVCTEYEKADIFVSTSRWEGSPNVVLEALSYGLPVVATQVGGVSDVMMGGREGLLVPSDDTIALTTALRTLLTDAQARKKYGMSAQARIRKDFSKEARFTRLRAIVEKS